MIMRFEVLKALAMEIIALSDSSTQVSNVLVHTVRCKVYQFFQIFPLFFFS
jgi:hypothetical protein